MDFRSLVSVLVSEQQGKVRRRSRGRETRIFTQRISLVLHDVTNSSSQFRFLSSVSMDLWLLIITWGWCRAVANLPNIFQAGWLPLLGGCLGSSSSLRTRPTWLPFWPFLVSTRPSTRWMTWLPNTKFYTLPKTVATSLPTLNGWPTSKNDSTSNKMI